MARNVANSVENNFTRGLITEASGLNFPENACTDTDNCHFELTGRVRRRLGIDIEPNNLPKTIDRAGSAISMYLWRNVSGDGTINLLVLQVGDTLYFYNVSGSTSVSDAALSTTIDLTSLQPSGAADAKSVECQYSDGFGYLFVTHPYVETFYITYDTTAQTVSATEIDVKIRDFTGDSADPLSQTDPSRPTGSKSTIDKHHLYNLYNQGWTDANLDTWDGAATDMPNNIDVMWTFKDSAGDFSMSTVPKVVRGNTPAPRGHYIFSAFNQDRATVGSVPGATVVTTGYQRMSTCAFFAGRVFYGGLQYSGFAGNIYFSHILQQGSTNEFGQCYQIQDPTSEDLFDLLPDDGGVIGIPDAGTIIKLWATQGGLVAFATNGIWQITGSSGLGFAATDYTVRKISSIRTISHTSFVDVGGYPAWWASEGIYILIPDGSGLSVSVKSLTDQSILSYYNDIPLSSKKQARGFFDLISKKIQWVFKSTEASTPEEVYEFDKVLIFNTLTAAFNPWSFATSAVKVNGLFVIDNPGGNLSPVTIVDDAAETVVDDAGDTLVAYQISTQSVTPKFKYLVSYPSGGSYDFVFAEERDEAYVDWYTYDSVGVNFDSYFVTGYKVHGQGDRKFQSNYVFIFSKAIPGQFYFQGIWNYSNTGNSGKWGSRQYVTVSDTNYDLKMNRLKVRGEGIALQYRVQSVDGQPFDIVGWSVFESANASP